LNVVDPPVYFAGVLTKLVNLSPASRLNQLTPYRWLLRVRGIYGVYHHVSEAHSST